MAKKIEKNGFILYNNYEEQINMLSDDQAGQLIKGIFAYVRTGEEIHADPLVTMLFSMIARQMDIDIRRYQDTCKKRREAGKKGGRPRKQQEQGETLPPAETAAENQVVFPEKQTEAKKPDKDTETEIETEIETDTDTETDTEIETETGTETDLSKTGRRRHRHEEEARPREENDRIFVPYGGDQVATTEAEYQKVEQLARELFRSHAGKTPSPFDVEQVFRYVHRPAYDSGGDAYARYDTGKAELLRYVFERASLQNRMSWSYIDGIFSNYGRCGVETVGEAEEKEYCWNRRKA